MATDANESTASRKDDDVSDSSSPSDSDGVNSGDEAAAQKVEWLATTRARRSTAGNRMKAMLANEEPAAEDSDLELLFAEDEDDAGFTDVENDASDVQMDSSSDDEDQEEGADDLEGEKELERQAREKKNAQRKRKANEAIPAKFRKKVRIEQPVVDSASVSSATAPQQHKPRPKKKSERLSWLPTAADMPTRASERRTTKMSKEQLHQKMVKDEIRRKKQIEAMEKKAARLEAMKKPPMTQAERLAEAALVEKRNSKSLNRWEVAEKQREEERLRKIAALNSRKLDGPVVTFWSGIQELEEGQLKHVGKMVSIEEKAPRKKRQSAAATLLAQQIANANAAEASKPPSPTTPANPEANAVNSAAIGGADVKSAAPETPTVVQTVPSQPVEQPQQPQPVTAPAAQEDSSAQPVTTQDAPTEISSPKQPESLPNPGLLAPPPGPVASANSKQSSPPLLAAPVLAPPTSGVQPPALSPSLTNLNVNPNVIAVPDTSQTPLKSSETSAGPNAKAPLPSQSGQARPAPAPAPASRPTPPKLATNTSQAVEGKSGSKAPDTPQQATPTEPPREGKVTRSCIILQNFDEDAIKDKQVQTQILFGRKMNRLAKPAQAALCVITNHPARYRDPKTGLPFYNAHAYKEIQRTLRGDYKFSTITGAYAGSTKCAARGVPERFLDPTKPRSTPVTKPTEAGQGDQDVAMKPEDLPREQPQPTMPFPVVDSRLAPAPVPPPVRKQKATAARRVNSPKPGQANPPQARPQHQTPVAGQAFTPSPPINQSQVPARHPTPASGPVFAPPAPAPGPPQARTNTQSPAPVTGAVFAPVTSGPPHTQSYGGPHIPVTTEAVFAPIHGPSGGSAQPPFPSPLSTPSFMPHAPKHGYTPLPPPGPGFIPPVVGQTQAQAQAPVRSPVPVTNAVFAPPAPGQPHIPARPQGTLSADGSSMPSNPGQVHAPAPIKGPVFAPPLQSQPQPQIHSRPLGHVPPPALPGSAEEAIASVRSNRVATPPVPHQPQQGP